MLMTRRGHLWIRVLYRRGMMSQSSAFSFIGAYSQFRRLGRHGSGKIGKAQKRKIILRLCKTITGRTSRTRTSRVTSRLRCMTPKHGLTSSALLVPSELTIISLFSGELRMKIIGVYISNINLLKFLQICCLDEQASWRLYQLAIESLVQLELNGCWSKTGFAGYACITVLFSHTLCACNVYQGNQLKKKNRSICVCEQNVGISLFRWTSCSNPKQDGH